MYAWYCCLSVCGAKIEAKNLYFPNESTITFDETMCVHYPEMRNKFLLYIFYIQTIFYIRAVRSNCGCCFLSMSLTWHLWQHTRSLCNKEGVCLSTLPTNWRIYDKSCQHVSLNCWKIQPTPWGFQISPVITLPHIASSYSIHQKSKPSWLYLISLSLSLSTHTYTHVQYISKSLFFFPQKTQQNITTTTTKPPKSINFNKTFFFSFRFLPNCKEERSIEYFCFYIFTALILIPVVSCFDDSLALCSMLDLKITQNGV